VGFSATHAYVFWLVDVILAVFARISFVVARQEIRPQTAKIP
jgi:hypothetical protein